MERAMMNWPVAAVDDTEVDWPAASVLEQTCKALTGYQLLFRNKQKRKKVVNILLRVDLKSGNINRKPDKNKIKYRADVNK